MSPGVFEHLDTDRKQHVLIISQLNLDLRSCLSRRIEAYKTTLTSQIMNLLHHNHHMNNSTELGQF